MGFLTSSAAPRGVHSPGSMSTHVIRLHFAAPPKPAASAPCNGCGVCCSVAPCPVGMVVSGRRTGACKALTWAQEEGRYRCGMASDPRGVLPRLPALLAPLASRLALRWISAASGCDSTLEVDAGATPT